jgi:hypothetical protein
LLAGVEMLAEKMIDRKGDDDEAKSDEGFSCSDGQFNRAIGVALDASGNVFVSDFNNRVQKFPCP